ncbi:VENN motif pre-toxin domain-containing protein [Burkholderia pyrrocinia]|uniref:VENN motif pre-toxin domain-containing protein n=1 Tax=Burkholderia pyrrocinia TaxID=60550 RepID=UPI001FC8E261|nr:hypothetical protein [Burkholderia pyrrocinia]
MLSPLVLGAIDPTHAPLDQGQLAVLAAVATFAGGGLAGLAGQNAMAGATAAQNEALNNSSAGDHWAKPGQQNEGEKFVVNPTPQGAPVDQAQQGGGGGTDAEPVTVGSSSTVAGAAGGGNSAANAVNGLNLNKSLANQQQLSQLTSGNGINIAGNGTNVPLRDAPRLVSEYGGQASDWSKVSSSGYTAADGSLFEIHAYRNAVTGQVVEPKSIPLK